MKKVEKLKRGLDFAKNEIWDIDITSLSVLRRMGVKTLRIIHLVFRGFREDECPLHASALTFSTLMSIVPILALSLALARGLGDAEIAKSRVRDTIKDWTQQFGAHVETVIEHESESPASGGDSTGILVSTPVSFDVSIPGLSGDEADDEFSSEQLALGVNRVVDWVFEKAEKVSFTTIGGVGLVVLLLMVVQTLGQVESSFNRVWGVAVSRSMWRRFTDYLSVTVLTIVALSVPVADLASRFVNETAAASFKSFLGEGAIKEMTLLIVVWVIFTVIIEFMPNTRVRLRSAFAGGVVAGLLFRLWIWMCAAIQVGAAKYGKVYGSFAVVPILLAWIYVSWEIILFGAEVAFAVQNCTTYRMEQGSRFASVRSRIILALSVVVDAAKAMTGKANTLEVSAYARTKCVPVRFLNSIIEELVDAEVMGALSDDNGETYVLLKSPESMAVSDVVDVIMSSGVKPAFLGLDNVDARIGAIVGKYAEGKGNSVDGLSIQDLVGE